MAEIYAQNDEALGYWIGLLRLERAAKPLTLRILSLAARIGEFVVMHAKYHYNRPRPSIIAPGLMPPFGPPLHPSFPSGHATQAWLTAHFLKEVTRGNQAQSDHAPMIEWLSKRVAYNRERGGFHYRSDTQAGFEMADKCFNAIQTLLQAANPPPRLQEMFNSARGEW
jgi:hypothetical protein